MRLQAAVGLLLALAVFAPLAAGQGEGLSLQSSHEDLALHAGSAGDLQFVLSAAPDAGRNHVTITATAPPTGNWDVVVEVPQFILEAGQQQTINIDVVSMDNPSPRSWTLNVTVQAVSEGFHSQALFAVVEVRSTGTERILGNWDNPLPSPLDGAWGAFLLNAVAWLVITQITIWVLLPALRWSASRTPVQEDQKAVRILTRPIAILLSTFGIKQSLEVFELPAWVFDLLDRLWTVALSIVIVYVVYRLWKEIILGVGKRVAKSSESEVDDMLMPVFEKLGSVVILIVGLWIVVSSFGVDMTLFAAGGAVLSLVIAFAAQDTLGNFFAGIFILLDRPFRVGDRIELPEQNHWGDVQDVGLRTTKVRTLDNRMVIFPNSYIGANPVINHSYPDSNYRIQVEFLLPYGSDVEFIRKTLVDAVKPVEGVWDGKPVEALLLAFDEHGQKWRLRWWINSYVDTRRMFDRVNSAVIKQMTVEGIRIPYKQFTLWDAHKLLERESAGGLAPTTLSDKERGVLEREAEAERKKAERQEVAEVEETKRKHREKRAKKDDSEE